MTSWNDPMAGYRELKAREAKQKKDEAFKRFIRERLIYWSTTFLILGAFVAWALNA